MGSGFRSLICTKHLGLPPVLKAAARDVGISEKVWVEGLGSRKVDVDGLVGEMIEDEWEVWCDPGTVVWRFGGWEWEDVGYEPVKIVRGESTMDDEVVPADEMGYRTVQNDLASCSGASYRRAPEELHCYDAHSCARFSGYSNPSTCPSRYSTHSSYSVEYDNGRLPSTDFA
jgi:hypothetical protein